MAAGRPGRASRGAARWPTGTTRASRPGEHGNTATVAPLWDALYAAGADIVLNGHDHDYERFAPQTPAGVADPGAGIREFVVGTGGASHYAVRAAQPNSEVTQRRHVRDPRS